LTGHFTARSDGTGGGLSPVLLSVASTTELPGGGECPVGAKQRPRNPKRVWASRLRYESFPQRLVELGSAKTQPEGLA
jgi:hypothetical protein